ncbi:DUF885 domain-containing protein [Henriciella litoralis]|uniref:DUF885 domain-containing protein n=1 Tax=Henriciella litoralis TaxID=568102 RepID=UPI00146DA8AD|nr:DUF885 domain-containing protein [Henriciella litoralis]
MNRLKSRSHSLAMAAFSAALLAAACGPPVNEDGIARRTVREINRSFDDTARAEMALSPETATRLGLSESTMRQPFQNMLDDRSQARFERTRLLRIELLNRLNNTPDIPQDSQLARHLEIVRAQYEALTNLEAYGFGRYGPGIARPYAVDQLSGAWVDVPDMLISSHPLRSHEDAKNYLARLAALPDALGDEKRRLLSDAASGIIPPRFVLEALEARLREFAGQPVSTHPLIQTFGSVVGGLDPALGPSANTYRQAAARLMLKDVIPAYVEFANAVRDLQAEASPDPGLSSLPDGEAYYLQLLGFYTQPGVSADALHEEGLAAVADIRAEIDAQFAALGLTAGSVQERLRLLAASSEQIYTDEDDGRGQILRRLRTLIKKAQANLPKIVKNAPDATVLVRRMPSYEEAAFNGATYVGATANGSSPALIEINLRRLENWSDYALPTLAYHEAVPGHHVESMVAANQTRSPLIRQMIWDTAFGEGWATYAEDLADSAGLYANDPLGRIGYLQSILFRAARLVVDTGIHAEGWSYERAVSYLVNTTGLPRAEMEDEVARYAVWPGQAASYFTGRRRILEMRARAEAVLGGQLNAPAFNAVVLDGGPRPLSMVEKDVEDWYDNLLQD